MAFNQPITELTTAGTDAAMGVLCVGLVLRLRAVNTSATWSRMVWTWVFLLLVVASGLGAVAHGLALPAPVRSALWHPLYLSLGLSIALFMVAAVADGRGENASRALLPWAIGAGVAFFALSRLLGGAFLIFVVYEAVAMVVALGIYATLAARRHVPGAWIVSAGIALTLVAAAVQSSSLRLTLLVPLDHNGLFHLVQMVATVVVARGVGRLLVARP